MEQIMAITKEQVFEIAHELNANGKNPTLSLVRKQLGSGSYTTISEFMAEWKACKTAKESPLPSEPLPPVVAVRLSELGAELWSIAVDFANGRIATERELLEITRKEVEDSKKEAMDLADQLSAEVETLQEKTSRLETGIRTARLETDGLRLKNTELTERLAAAESRSVEIELRAKDLNAELTRVHGQNAEMLKTLTMLASGKRP
jgi:regulator of replication initiation timing